MTFAHCPTDPVGQNFSSTISSFVGRLARCASDWVLSRVPRDGTRKRFPPIRVTPPGAVLTIRRRAEPQ